MPKFSRKMIKGSDQLAEEMQKEKGDFKVGAGLINQQPALSDADNEVVYLHRWEIRKNKNNQYSIGNIKSLAWSINNLGLLQPLHVNKNAENGVYTLLGGERRLTAIDLLIADPDNAKWTGETLIPCMLKNPENIPLPLDAEMKETLSIISTNKESRIYTDADKLMEIREWKKIITALRDAGVESMPGTDEENEDGILIKGEKTRDILVKTTGMSRGTINKFEKVENQGSDKVKEALLNNEISLSTANTLASSLEKSHQDAVIDRARRDGREISVKEIQKAEAEEKADAENEKNTGNVNGSIGAAELNVDASPVKEAAVSKGYNVTEETFREDTINITKVLKKTNVYLDSGEQMQYYKYIRELERLLIKEN